MEGPLSCPTAIIYADMEGTVVGVVCGDYFSCFFFFVVVVVFFFNLFFFLIFFFSFIYKFSKGLKGKYVTRQWLFLVGWSHIITLSTSSAKRTY